MHCESASSWFEWLFRVSRIFVWEGYGNQYWLTALSPGVVVHPAIGAALLLLSFFNHLVLDSVVSLFPIGMFVLCGIRIFIFSGVIPWCLPSGRSLYGFIVRPLPFVFCVETFVGLFSFSLRRGYVRGC